MGKLMDDFCDITDALKDEEFDRLRPQLERLSDAIVETEKTRKSKNYDAPGIYKQAIETYGPKAQMNMAVEEMSELTKEILKNQRGYANREHIIEELVDVYITLEQLVIIFKISQREMQIVRDRKLERLAFMLSYIETCEEESWEEETK